MNSGNNIWEIVRGATQFLDAEINPFTVNYGYILVFQNNSTNIYAWVDINSNPRSVFLGSSEEEVIATVERLGYTIPSRYSYESNGNGTHNGYDNWLDAPITYDEDCNCNYGEYCSKCGWYNDNLEDPNPDDPNPDDPNPEDPNPDDPGEEYYYISNHDGTHQIWSNYTDEYIGDEYCSDLGGATSGTCERCHEEYDKFDYIESNGDGTHTVYYIDGTSDVVDCSYDYYSDELGEGPNWYQCEGCGYFWGYEEEP